MGEGGGLARHAAQAEAGLGVEIGGLQPAVVEAEALRGGILKVELAIVAALQRVGGEAQGGIGIEPVGAIEEAAGICAHASHIGGPRRKSKAPEVRFRAMARA